VACHGSVGTAPSDTAAGALASAFEHHHRAEDDARSTVRELTATYQELAIAYGIMETISQPTPRETIAQDLLAHVASAVNADGCCLLYLSEAGSLEPLAVNAMPAAELQAIWRRLMAASGEASRLDEPFVVPVGERQILVSGLYDEAGCEGLVALARAADQPFNSREAKMLQAAGRQAILALRNRALVDDLRSLFMSTVQALVAAIEIKDAYTCGHSRRVAQAARDTAQLLGLSASRAEDVYMAGVVHDIGKIAIEKAVLCKPGKLSPAEWEIVRGHPEHGAGIIDCVPQLRHLVAGIRHHHERRDGRGYPAGLSEDEIPLEAGIIAVADTYDAMTSQRSYRPGMSAPAAVEELRACSGPQFSGDIVQAFIETVGA